MPCIVQVAMGLILKASKTLMDYEIIAVLTFIKSHWIPNNQAYQEAQNWK